MKSKRTLEEELKLFNARVNRFNEFIRLKAPKLMMQTDLEQLKKSIAAIELILKIQNG